MYQEINILGKRNRFKMISINCKNIFIIFIKFYHISKNLTFHYGVDMFLNIPNQTKPKLSLQESHRWDILIDSYSNETIKPRVIDYMKGEIYY